jgi:hypothetical protein
MPRGSSTRARILLGKRREPALRGFRIGPADAAATSGCFWAKILRFVMSAQGRSEPVGRDRGQRALLIARRASANVRFVVACLDLSTGSPGSRVALRCSRQQPFDQPASDGGHGPLWRGRANPTRCAGVGLLSIRAVGQPPSLTNRNQSEAVCPVDRRRGPLLLITAALRLGPTEATPSARSARRAGSGARLLTVAYSLPPRQRGNAA